MSSPKPKAKPKEEKPKDGSKEHSKEQQPKDIKKGKKEAQLAPPMRILEENHGKDSIKPRFVD